MKLWQLFFLSTNMLVATNTPKTVGVVLCIGWIVLTIKAYKENV
jgi:uncharacterized membrane protein YgdD (TMEM256/DUF423 family)